MKVRWPSTLRIAVVGIWVAAFGAVLATEGSLFGAWPLVAGGGFAFLVGLAMFAVWLAAPEKGGHVCLIFQFSARRVHHLHRPKADIVNCRRSVGFHHGRADT